MDYYSYMELPLELVLHLPLGEEFTPRPPPPTPCICLVLEAVSWGVRQFWSSLIRLCF